MKPTSTDAMLAEIFQSPEYQGALRERLIAGTARAGELEIAKKVGLGLAPADADPDEDRKREAYSKMPKFMRTVMLRLIRAANGETPMPACREIRGGGGGLVFLSEQEWPRDAQNQPVTVQEPPMPAPMTDDEVDLMPQAFPRT